VDYLPAAMLHLQRDKKLGKIITTVGDFQPRPVKQGEYFRILSFSIISQMLSTKAAATIRDRLIAQVKPAKVTPESVLRLTHLQLRGIGLSTTKAEAMHDLARRAQCGDLPLKHFVKLEDDEITEHLIAVRGIGKWTTQMFLMFGLVRPDVWPIDDLGIRAAIKKLDKLPEMPDKQYMLTRGDRYAPYRTVASWYLWQSLTVKS
jgi:DNA-3-methyladenine glycosylase II